MGARLLIRYLLGDAPAILELAKRSRLLVGSLLVLSAGVAREYDGARPAWHLLLPFGSSLAASFALFILAFRGLRGHATRPPFLAAYRVFLSLFWLTAPLAWLYAVPYERFLTDPGAMKANLATLGVVSAWRVWLMTRVLSVVMGYRPRDALMVVMAFADAVVLASLVVVPVPLIDLMGGIELSKSEQVLRDVAVAVFWIGLVSFPVWTVGAVVALRRGTPEWKGVPPG